MPTNILTTDERNAMRDRLTKFINYDLGKAIREKLHADAKIDYKARSSSAAYMQFLNRHGGAFLVTHPQLRVHPFYYTFLVEGYYIGGDCVEECLDNAINEVEIRRMKVDEIHRQNLARYRAPVDEEARTKARKRYDQFVREQEKCELFVTFMHSKDYLLARSYFVGNEDVHSFVAMSNVPIGGFHVWARTKGVIEELKKIGGDVFVKQEKADG